MIAFISDWGYNSYYVGVAKCVIHSISPASKVIDLIHTVSHFNIIETAHIVERVFGDLPKKSVLLSVVDPGVGTQRKPIALKIKNKYCVGPDNGIFSRILPDEYECRIIENPKYMYRFPPSNTFHGRDVFAPAAAYLDSGVDIVEFGREWNPTKLEFSMTEVGEGFLKCEVAYVDGFGNVETTVTIDELKKSGIGKVFTINGVETTVAKSYADVSCGLLAHFDSSRYMEISVNQGSAAEILGVSSGDVLLLERKKG